MTQKSESVREAEQRNPAEKFFSENKSIGVLEPLAYAFNDQQRDIIFDFAVLYAGHAIGSLAEKAEQEAKDLQAQHGWESMKYAIYKLSICAAWLREKAR